MIFRHGFTLGILTFFINVVVAQVYTTNLSQEQVLNLQKLSIREIDNLLRTNGWVQVNASNSLKDYFNYSFELKSYQWEQRIKNEWQGTVCVFNRLGIPNIVVYQTTESNYSMLKPTFLQLLKEENFEIGIMIKYGLAMEFRKYFNEKSSRKYSILCYDVNSLKNMTAKEKRKNNEALTNKKSEVTGKLPLENNTIQKNFDSALSLGDQYFNQKHFEQALIQYKSAIQYLDREQKEFDVITEKINNCNKEIGRALFEDLKNQAEELFEKEKYREALSKYQNALKINTHDTLIIQRIKCLSGLVKLFEKSQENYQKVNPDNYISFVDNNYRIMNSVMGMNKEKGQIKYKIIIRFTQNGNNLSQFKIDSISDDQFMFYLSDLNISEISPVPADLSCFNKKFFIPVSDSISFNLNWNSRNIKTLVRGERITFPDYTPYNSRICDTIRSFIKRLPPTNGIYTFNLVEKRLNDKYFEDLRLTSLHDKESSKNIISSMLLPGSGTIKASGGTRGKDRLIIFLMTAAFSLGSKIYSDLQYDKYQNPENYNRDKYYRNADLANKAAIISGGIAAGIYLYDLIDLIHKSDRDHKKNRNLLRNGPVTLLDSPLKP